MKDDTAVFVCLVILAITVIPMSLWYVVTMSMDIDIVIKRCESLKRRAKRNLDKRTVTTMNEYVDIARILVCSCSPFFYLVVTGMINAVANTIMGNSDNLTTAWITGMILFSAAVTVAIMGVTV